MYMKKIIFLLTLIICQVSVSQVLVSYTKGDNIDFSSFKTYQIDNFDVMNIPEFEPKKEG